MATPETHGLENTDVGLAQHLARDPFQAELPLLPPDPAYAEPGDVVEVGNVCQDCGKARDYWIFVPMLPSTKKTKGWALHQNRPCFCEMEADERKRRAWDFTQTEITDQGWLDRTFFQRPYREWTFLHLATRYCGRLSHRFEAVERKARDLQTPPARGLALVAPPDSDSDKLLAAYLNAARANGQTTLLMSVAQLLELTVPVLDEDERPRTERNRRRLALRSVDHLGLLGLFDYPMLPSERKELALLLTYRTTEGAPPRATHVTVSRPLLKVKASYRNQPGLLGIAAAVEALTEEVS